LRQKGFAWTQVVTETEQKTEPVASGAGDERKASRERLRKALRAYQNGPSGTLPQSILETLGDQIGAASREGLSTALVDALEQMSLAITITDSNATILYANHSFETLSGYALEELIGQKQSINSNKMTPLTVYKSMWESILAGQTWNGRLLNRHKNGETYVIDLTITPIRADSGEISYFLGIHTDATELHELERKFSNQKALIESVINLAPVVMALIDTERNVILDNLAYKTLMGDMMQGLEPAEFFLSALEDEIGTDLNAACLPNKTFTGVEVCLEAGPGRQPRWFSCSGNWVKEFDVRPDSYFSRRTKDALLLVCTDISLRRLEYQRAKYSAVRALMVEQQMVHRIREIVTAAAFQLQGPLNVINAMSAMAERQQWKDRSIVVALEQATLSGKKAIETLENAIPHIVEEPYATININELLREVLVVSMERMTSYDVAVDWHPSMEPINIQGRPFALRNMFKNLLDNAIDAIEEGTERWRKIRVVTTHSANGAEIRIEDSGPGMSREIRSRAFEPFFSGWPKLRGKSGMGLSIARQIAVDHGGNIEIDERCRSGSRIRVFLPLQRHGKCS
jgi:nitrogen fixation regulatory protein